MLAVIMSNEIIMGITGVISTERSEYEYGVKH